MNQGSLIDERRHQLPRLPALLQNIKQIKIEQLDATNLTIDPQIKDYFELKTTPPLAKFALASEQNQQYRALKVGVVCSGGQAPGGHNVIIGLFHTLKKFHETSSLIGFLKGPAGIVNNRFIQLEKSFVEEYLNSGGFDMIGSGRTKIETKEQFAKALATCQSHQLDGLVIIGGDDSNTNAALLAKYFAENHCSTQVVGVPKTIDGDLKNEFCEISFGHDTACKLYSELIGNIARDAMSACKYYHFIRLMGRSASHITLECALQTQPTAALIAEEVREKNQTLGQIVTNLCEIVKARQTADKEYGVILIPEGLIEFIPEFRALIDELNELQAKQVAPAFETLRENLSPASANLLATLPTDLAKQLYLDRDPHGNVQVSRIETEKMLADLVEKELKKESYVGKFSAVTHFFGYEARASMPTIFDSNYTYALGATAASLIDNKCSGYLATLSGLSGSVDDFRPNGIPLVSLMNMERRGGQLKPVIQKALVEINGPAFRALEKLRRLPITEDHFIYPGPIQYFGPASVSDSHIKTLDLETASRDE